MPTHEEKLAQKAKLTARLDAVFAEIDEIATETAKLRADMNARLLSVLDASPTFPDLSPRAAAEADSRFCRDLKTTLDNQTEKMKELTARHEAAITEVMAITNEMEKYGVVAMPTAPDNNP